MPDITSAPHRREERVDTNTLRVTRKSTFTGVVRSLHLPITEYQERQWKTRGVLIQDALPNLTNAEREFLLTGTTQEEWDAAFPPEEDE